MICRHISGDRSIQDVVDVGVPPGTGLIAFVGDRVALIGPPVAVIGGSIPLIR